MSECEHAPRISAYHDGELPESSRLDLEAHIRQCPVCAAELARLQGLSRLLAGLGRSEMPREALERVHQAVDRQPNVALVRMAEVFTAVAASILVVSSVWLWKISAAGAAPGQIPLWETAAVAPQDPSGVAAQEQLARWIVQDLSRKNGHD